MRLETLAAAGGNNNNNIIKRPTLPDVQSMTGTRKHIDTIRPAMVLSAVIEREMRGGRPERRLAAAPATSKPPTLKQQQSTRINWKLSTRLTSFHRCQRQAQTFQFNSIQFNSIQFKWTVDNKEPKIINNKERKKERKKEREREREREKKEGYL